MTDEEIAEFFFQWEEAGKDVREAWLKEFVRHPEGRDRLSEMIEEADGDVAKAIAALTFEFADAPRRNQRQSARARTPRKDSWQQALADYLNSQQGRDGRALNREQKFARLPESEEHSKDIEVGQHEYSFYRDEKFVYAKKLGVEGAVEKSIAKTTLFDWMKRPRKT